MITIAGISIFVFGDEFMLHERRDKIVKMIISDRMVKVADLVKIFDVSIETIRRDLEYLENQGYLKRVYGGAVLHGLFGQEPDYSHREVKNYIEKRAIGIKTSELIEDGDTIAIDLGTTTLEVARALAGKNNLTIITNATKIAQELVVNESNRVFLMGGMLRPGELSVSGFMCSENLKQFNVDKAIIGVGGITLDRGITDYHIEEANNRRTIINIAEKVIAVADFSKFGVIAMNNVCSINKINILVTDSAVPQKTISDYRSRGINVIAAEKAD